MRQIAIKGRLSCMTENYLNSLKRLASESARSASCRCLMINQNLHFIHAAANRFVKAVIMLITKAVEAVDVHSVESRIWKVKKKMTRD
jgi:hypothetical protein